MSYWKWLFSLLSLANIKNWDRVTKGVVIIVLSPIIALIFVLLSAIYINEFSLIIGITIFLLIFSYGYYVTEVKK